MISHIRVKPKSPQSSLDFVECCQKKWEIVIDGSFPMLCQNPLLASLAVEFWLCVCVVVVVVCVDVCVCVFNSVAISPAYSSEFGSKPAFHLNCRRCQLSNNCVRVGAWLSYQ